MKVLIVFFSLLSVQAFACPNFTGKYICEEDGTSYTMQMTQKPIAGGMQYISTYEDNSTEDLYVDGQTHSLNTEHPEFTYVATCGGNAVNGVVKGPIIEDGQEVGNMRSNVKYAMNGRNLETNGTTIIFYGDEAHQQDFSTVCVGQ